MSRPLVRALTVVASAAALALSAPAGPGAAAPPERGTFDDAFSVPVADFCGSDGLDVVLDAVLTGRFQFGPRRDDGLQYWLEQTRFEEVITNTATGEHVRVVTRSVGKDLRVTDNGDGTLTVLFLATGNTTVSDAAGKAIARNPGQVRLSFLLDHAGTPTDPTDDAFLAPPEVVKDSTGRSDDVCAAVVGALT